MYFPASTSLKTAYVIAVLAAVVPFGLASSGWVGLAIGGRAGAGVPFVGPLLLLILGIYRIFSVIRVPGTLDSYQVSGFALVLRKIGAFALYLGVLVAVLNLISRPLMAAFISHRSESGVEFFVVGTYLALLGGFGSLGILMFEFSRILGFERQTRSQ